MYGLTVIHACIKAERKDKGGQGKDSDQFNIINQSKDPFDIMHI